MAKRVSYGYLIFAAILIIGGLGLGIYGKVIFSGIIFAVMFAATYLISTRMGESRNSWILLIACAVISVILSHGAVAIALGILLVISANDIRKELD